MHNGDVFPVFHIHMKVFLCPVLPFIYLARLLIYLLYNVGFMKRYIICLSAVVISCLTSCNGNGSGPTSVTDSTKSNTASGSNPANNSGNASGSVDSLKNKNTDTMGGTSNLSRQKAVNNSNPGTNTGVNNGANPDVH